MLKVRRSRLYTLWFGWYSRRQFRRYFNSVRIVMQPGVRSMDNDTPVVFYCNHAYWWDGFWSQICTEVFFNQNLHIIIGLKELQKHRFFTRIGAFSLDRSNARSAVKTLDYAADLLTTPSSRQNALWIFPQGLIEHVDKRPLFFFRGTEGIVNRVLRTTSRIYLVSVVSRIEYVEEQKPELFLSFQEPWLIDRDDLPEHKNITDSMQKTTEFHLDALKTKIIQRQLDDFEMLLKGTDSVNRKVDKFRCFFRQSKGHRK
ncbi:lysophospholipid acyltransferase family protein [Chlorobium phaeobacteroides]|uniref:Phospholipid/glycerol acyltransferase n=1 Tax=Chlorobium phaeobacteroides (strain DSM 266 / SMG 266 / 2430) TaxID=290317 RepID=A1BF83_CHLPD|nr:lysophospholipid acyltransferase family protein [Chlorobium phaeobacteroides]ABL65060.1 phospholipid/glycerol acyltransferase [Chlorobium phaeobacteroides DSM 266]